MNIQLHARAQQERTASDAKRPGIAGAFLADGENVAIGNYLESNGAGYLQKHTEDTESWESGSIQEGRSITIYSQQIVAQALEALDLSDSSGGESSGALGYNKRIKVRFV